MAEERVQRRLAAILAADVVGYSRLIRQDESGTLSRLKALRKNLFEPSVAANDGRIVKTMGDGVLIEFPSAVRALQHAVELQRAMAARNADAPPQGALELRIGINVGDVVIDEDDVFGDGVNVAARLEALAEPGGICISEDVHRQVRGRVDVAFDELGEMQLKNIDEPVRVFRVILDRPPDSVFQRDETPSASLGLPSIAVLPFDNLSGDPDQEYFSDGITEDIISALSRIRFIFVIARNSTFAYKGQAPDIRRVATELGARYVLEGSVRKAGDRIRVTVQLIDGGTGNHLWAERYDRKFDDIFDVQDDITETVVGALQPELGKAEQARAKARRPQDLSAWDAYQRGMWHTYRRTKQDLNEAMDYFRQAMAQAPDFAPAFWGAAVCIFYTAIWGGVADRDALLDEALSFARNSIAIDPNDSMAHTSLAYTRLVRQEHDEVVPACQTAVELDPNNYLAPRILGIALATSGRSAEALPHLNRAVQLSPRDPMVSGAFAYMAMANLFLGDLQAGAEWARRAMRNVQEPQTWAFTTALSVFGQLNLVDDARRTLDELLRIKPEISCTYVRDNIPISSLRDLDIYMDGLRKAGLPEK